MANWQKMSRASRDVHNAAARRNRKKWTPEQRSRYNVTKRWWSWRNKYRDAIYTSPDYFKIRESNSLMMATFNLTYEDVKDLKAGKLPAFSLHYEDWKRHDDISTARREESAGRVFVSD